MKKIHIILATLVMACVVGAGVYVARAQIVLTGPMSVNGWGWSSNIGHISFSSSTPNAGGTSNYGVTLGTSGLLTGYAWSSNIGWISFNSSDLTGCSGSAPATVNLSNGNVSGWIRAIAGKDTANNNGWDGCITLSGTNHLTGDTTGNGGITLVKLSDTQSVFRGYAWGGSVVGWLTFSPNINLTKTDCNPAVEVCGGTGGGPSLSCNVTSGNLPATGGNATITADLTGGSGTYTFTLNPGDGSTATPLTDSTHVSFSQLYQPNNQEGAVNYTASVTVSGAGPLPNPATVTCNNAVTVAGTGTPPPGGSAAAVYIGSTVSEINSAITYHNTHPTAPLPVYLEIKASDPVALKWTVPTGYSCERSLTSTSGAIADPTWTQAGNWSGNVSSGSSLSSPPLDTTNASKGTFNFNLKNCSGVDSGGAPLPSISDASATLLIYYSTVGEQ